ncbi:MAG TPA: TadE family protein [Acidimicrobiales bacterium]|nr:TadE family protein [Acidimicrobiales bacterium]
MRHARGRGDRGSLTVELVVLTPVVVMFALATLAFGRLSQARQQVVEAAQAGAQAAAVGSNAADAQQAAQAAASTGILASNHTCANPQIRTNVAHFVPGGYVVVEVTCHVELSDLLVPGLPGATTVQASSTAPLDPYRSMP